MEKRNGGGGGGGEVNQTLRVEPISKSRNEGTSEVYPQRPSSQVEVTRFPEQLRRISHKRLINANDEDTEERENNARR